jgi:hypothetical protein
VSRSESSRWQELADVPEDQRREYVEATKAAKGEVSTAGLLKHVKAGPSTPTGRMSARVEAFSHDPETAGAARAQLAQDLQRALDVLPTFPPAAVAGLEADDRARLNRTVRRVTQWFAYLTGELRRELGDKAVNGYERLEAVHTLIYEWRGICGDPAVVQVAELVDRTSAEDRPLLLTTVRAFGEWLAGLEAELIRQGATGEAELTDE